MYVATNNKYIAENYVISVIFLQAITRGGDVNICRFILAFVRHHFVLFLSFPLTSMLFLRLSLFCTFPCFFFEMRLN
jgi:hypothetical protein